MKRLTVLFLLSTVSVFSQNWSLEKCLTEALENNLAIQSQKVAQSIANESIKTSKLNFSPSVNGGATHGYNWGQTIDPFTNQFATNQVQSNSFYLSSSLTLFNGLQNHYDLKVSQLSAESESYNTQVIVRNYKIEVATTYFQALLNNEVLEIAQEQLNLTKIQLQNVNAHVENRNQPEWKKNEVEAQLKTDEYLVLKAQNDLNYTLLLLQHLMGKDYNAQFNIQKVDSSIVLVNTNEIDVSKLPEIKRLATNILMQENEVKATKSRALPTLGANGSIGTGYSGNNKTFDSNGLLNPKPFRDQVDENFYQSISFSLNIPIFNQFRNTQQAKVASLRIDQQKLDLAQEQFLLTQRIEKLKFDINAGILQVQSLENVLASVALNTENYQLQFKLGAITNNELQIQKDKLFEAQSNLLQNKYKLYLNQFVLHCFTKLSNHSSYSK